MQTILSPEQLKAMFTGQKLNIAYYENVNLYAKLRMHANGEVPIHLIKNARPNESDEVRAYRESIYETETQNPIEKVLGLLEKIRRSPDWMIRFDEKVPAIINEDETLQEYLNENYPVYQKFETWIFEEALKTAALDANAVIVIIPKELNFDSTKYVEPYAQIFNSKQVLEYVADDYVVVKSDDLSNLLTPLEQQQRLQANTTLPVQLAMLGSHANQMMQEQFVVGQVYYVINTFYYEKWEATSDGKFQLTEKLIHNLGGLPAFQMPGKYLKRIGKNIIKKTPLHPMVPHLNKAARESNDLDAGVIMHLFLEKWRINNVPCGDCNGTGRPTTGGTASCKKCSGSGMATGKSPFNEVVIKPAGVGEQQMPTPPLGYVEKNPEILKLQNERIKEHIYRALASVNMEHLGEAPLNQSGTAKELDRDDLNNLIYTFAESIVFITNNIIYWINELRYKGLITDKMERRKLLPFVSVPEKFDVINSSFLITEYKSGKDAGLSSIILDELQKEIAQKKFSANPKVSSFVQTVLDVDPFSDKTIEEKSMMESQGLATKEDVVLSNYISDFVRQALEVDETFTQKTITQKRALLYTFAKKKVEELNVSKQISQDILGGANPDNSGGVIP